MCKPQCYDVMKVFDRRFTLFSLSRRSGPQQHGSGPQAKIRPRWGKICGKIPGISYPAGAYSCEGSLGRHGRIGDNAINYASHAFLSVTIMSLSGAHLGTFNEAQWRPDMTSQAISTIVAGFTSQFIVSLGVSCGSCVKTKTSWPRILSPPDWTEGITKLPQVCRHLIFDKQTNGASVARRLDE